MDEIKFSVNENGRISEEGLEKLTYDQVVDLKNFLDEFIEEWDEVEE